MLICLCYIKGHNNQQRPQARYNVRYSMPHQRIHKESKNYLEVDHMYSIAMIVLGKPRCQKILLEPSNQCQFICNGYFITIEAPENPIKPRINHCNRPSLKLKLTPGTTVKQMLLMSSIPVAKQFVITSGWDRVPILEIAE